MRALCLEEFYNQRKERKLNTTLRAKQQHEGDLHDFKAKVCGKNFSIIA